MNEQRIGVGLGLRPELKVGILENYEEIDVLEFIPEGLFAGDPRKWEEIRELSPVFSMIPHGVNLSIASVDCLEHTDYLRDLDRLRNWIDFPYYSDHFALTKVLGSNIGHLSPPWLTEEQLEVVAGNIIPLQDRLGLKLVLENITTDFELLGAEMRPVEFLNRAVELTGCGLLLDLANVFITAHNMSFDADEFLETLNLSAVRQIHLAGGIRHRDMWLDTHSAPIQEEVWKLFGRVAGQCPNLQVVIIERDNGFGDFSELLDEVRRAKSLWPAPVQAMALETAAS